MPLFHGGQRVARLYRGATPVARAYRGAALVHGPAARASFLGAVTFTANLSEYTQASFALGTPQPSRRIVVFATNSGSGTDAQITGLSVRGVSAELVRESNTPDTARSLWIAHVPEGGSGTIQFQCVAAQRAHIGVHRIVGLSVNAPFQNPAAASANPGPASIGFTDLPPGSVVIAGTRRSAVTSCTLLGNGASIEDYDGVVESNYTVAGGHANIGAETPGYSVSSLFANNATTVLIAAAWKP